MENSNSRFNKWKKYRQDIDSGNNLDLSIINSDKDLKHIFSLIDFDIEKAYLKSGYKTESVITEHYKSSEIIHLKEINKIVNSIEKIEILNKFNNINELSTLNSHINDEIINDNFQEFVDKDFIKEQKKQETTDLKINKYTISNKGNGYE